MGVSLLTPFGALEEIVGLLGLTHMNLAKQLKRLTKQMKHLPKKLDSHSADLKRVLRTPKKR